MATASVSRVFREGRARLAAKKHDSDEELFTKEFVSISYQVTR